MASFTGIGHGAAAWITARWLETSKRARCLGREL
jgi:hypothetical protein